MIFNYRKIIIKRGSKNVLSPCHLVTSQIFSGLKGDKIYKDMSLPCHQNSYSANLSSPFKDGDLWRAFFLSRIPFIKRLSLRRSSEASGK